MGGGISQLPRPSQPLQQPHPATKSLRLGTPVGAKTVQELERELLYRSGGVRGGKTVQELEREMMAHPGGDTAHQQSAIHSPAPPRPCMVSTQKMIFFYSFLLKLK